MTAELQEPCGSGQPSLQPEDVLCLMGELLGASFERDGGNAQRKMGMTSGGDDEVGSTRLLVSNLHESASFSCPALSLSHKEHSDIDHSNRKHAEDYAVSLLSRPIAAGRKDTFIAETPNRLMQNVYQSFAVLVDSRLRAYANFLAKHGLSLLDKTSGGADGIVQVEEKLETLLKLGGDISAASVATKFEVAETVAEVDDDVVQLPLQLQVRMDVVIPRPGADTETVPVSFAVPGHITGTFTDSRLQDLKVRLEMKEFLAKMMSQASRIVAIVVEMANGALNSPEKNLQRGDSFLAMPPPLPKFASLRSEPNYDHGGLDLLSKMAAELPIVSPNVSSLGSPAQPVPNLELEEDEDVSGLSADQCADIVDGVFGGFDDAILIGPPQKKAKTET